MKTDQETSVCFVANFKYIYKHFPRISKELRLIGNFNGEIVLITNLFAPTFLIKETWKKSNVKILRFRNIKFDKNTHKHFISLNIQPNRYLTKYFQWNKLYLFHPKLKRWKYIFYLDINMTIHHDLNLLLSIHPKNQILARADGYPDYVWKLDSQFDQTHKQFNKLKKVYDLRISNYFQTGLMYYDTSIITKNTFKEIIELIKKFPISITNEQGILNIYFIFIKNQYSELVETLGEKITYYYWMLDNKEVMITKALRTKYK